MTAIAVRPRPRRKGIEFQLTVRVFVPEQPGVEAAALDAEAMILGALTTIETETTSKPRIRVHRSQHRAAWTMPRGGVLSDRDRKRD